MDMQSKSICAQKLTSTCVGLPIRQSEYRVKDVHVTLAKPT